MKGNKKVEKAIADEINNFDEVEDGYYRYKYWEAEEYKGDWFVDYITQEDYRNEGEDLLMEMLEQIAKKFKVNIYLFYIVRDKCCSDNQTNILTKKGYSKVSKKDYAKGGVLYAVEYKEKPTDRKFKKTSLQMANKEAIVKNANLLKKQEGWSEIRIVEEKYAKGGMLDKKHFIKFSKANKIYQVFYGDEKKEKKWDLISDFHHRDRAEKEVRWLEALKDGGGRHPYPPFKWAKGGITETKEFIAEYDMDNFLNRELEYLIDNPGDFEEQQSYLLDEQDEREEYEEDKEQYIRHWFDTHGHNSFDWYWEDVKGNLDTEFDKYIGERVFVKGSNMGWRNREGTKTFVLEDSEEMLRELVPENTDFIYSIYKIKDGEYEARVSHHDSPMGENFDIKIEPNNINRIYLENNDEERIGLIYVDRKDLRIVEDLEAHKFENFSHWKDEDEDDEGNYVVLQYNFEDTKKNINKNFDKFVKHFPNSTLTEDVKEINY